MLVAKTVYVHSFVLDRRAAGAQTRERSPNSSRSRRNADSHCGQECGGSEGVGGGRVGAFEGGAQHWGSRVEPVAGAGLEL